MCWHVVSSDLTLHQGNNTYHAVGDEYPVGCMVITIRQSMMCCTPQDRQLSMGLNTLTMIEYCLGCGPRSGAEGRVLRLG
jgi:hypothetical protein